jgi:hypothetical protein
VFVRANAAEGTCVRRRSRWFGGHTALMVCRSLPRSSRERVVARVVRCCLARARGYHQNNSHALQARAVQQGPSRSSAGGKTTMMRTACAITTVLGGALVGILYGCSMKSSSSQLTTSPGGSTGVDAAGPGAGGGTTATCAAFTPITIQPPCHPTTCTPGFCMRGDIAPLGTHPETQALQDRLATLACSPRSVAPLQTFAEADAQSQLFMYYLLDSTGFQPSVFTTRIPGLNDTAMLTVFGADCGVPTIGSVRLALEPKPGLPTDPDDVRAFIDVFTDIRGLFVINNESGWYEGWMIHDLRVAPATPKGQHGPAPIGMITHEDANLLARMGSGNNRTPGNFFTVDGKAPHAPSPDDIFPERVTNLVPLNLSMGAYNSLQQSDAHNYWEFNYTTNWIHPLYELPFAGGLPDRSPTQPADTYLDGEISARDSIVPGNSPASNNRSPALAIEFGDNPDLPRDPDKFDADDDAQREFRERFIPSGIAREVMLNAFERLASFEPGEHNLQRRLLDGYRAAVALVDTNGDGIISAAEGDVDTPNPHCPQGDNTCIFLPARTYNRFAVTREINDGLLGPRFAPSTRGWVLSGPQVTNFGPFGASEGRDSDDR